MRKLVYLIAFVFVSSLSFSQVQFGLDGGLNIATIKGDDVGGSMGTRSGFNGGVTVRLPITEQFYIEPEVKYSSEGGDEDDVNGYSLRIKNNYINVPVKLGYQVNDMFGLFVAPQVQFNTDFNYDYGDNSNVNIPDARNSVFGFLFGADAVTASGFGGGLGYAFGLNNIFEHPNGQDADAKSKVFNANLIYRFGGK